MSDSADPATETSERTVGRRRVVAAVVLAIVIVTGLAVHRWAPGAFGDIAGDALYAAAAYLAAVIVLPRLSPIACGAIALTWCAAVELFQLTGVPLVWGAAVPALKLVLGTGFDARDLVVYTAAVAASVVIDLLAGRPVDREEEPRPHRP